MNRQETDTTTTKKGEMNLWFSINNNDDNDKGESLRWWSTKNIELLQNIFWLLRYQTNGKVRAIFCNFHQKQKASKGQNTEDS